jgi:XTP/dITP diphosphohydrolase
MGPELKPPSTLLLGTTNLKKILELRPALEPLGFNLVDLSAMRDSIEVEETGETFIENARLKARVQAKHHGLWTIGEDSGLCVPALGGQPGVYSARYAGLGAGDEANNDLLLANMAEFRGDQRAAFYVSTMCLASPDGECYVEAEGRCWGQILNARRGTGGFGYDPLFEVVERRQTFAELDLAAKNLISHRGQAIQQFKVRLSQWLINQSTGE